MKRSVAALYALAFSVALLAAPSARANDAAAAQALFDKGKQLMAAGQLKQACEAFDESMKLDPGVGTKYQLGRCYEQQGRIASAWSAYLETASLAKAAGQNQRAAAARKKAEQLEPKLSKLTVQTSSDAPADMTVIIGDTTVRKAAWGTAIPFDAGEHDVEASADGYQTYSGSVTVPPDAGRVTLAIPTLMAAPEPQPQPSGPAEPVPAGVSTRDDTMFWGGIVSMGVGIAALAGGGAWLGIELSQDVCFEDDNFQLICEGPPTSVLVPPVVVMSAGGVLAGVGVLLIVLSDGDDGPSSEDAAAVQLRPVVGPTYVGVAGSF